MFAEGGGYVYHVKSINGGDNNLAPLAGLGLTAKLHDWVDIQARYRYMVRVGDDPDNDKVGSGTQRWVSDISTATLELVIHPNRSKPVEPAPPPWSFPATTRSRAGGSDLQPEFGRAVCVRQGGAETGGMQALESLYQQIADVKPRMATPW